MTLADIRDFLKTLDCAQNYYVGKLDSKKEQSIGVYAREQGSGNYRLPLGGLENKTYDEKTISVLVHWNNNSKETEEAAFSLQQKLESLPRNFLIGDTEVFFVRMIKKEPIDVGSDEKGIYEYVIWLDFIYRK